MVIEVFVSRRKGSLKSPPIMYWFVGDLVRSSWLTILMRPCLITVSFGGQYTPITLSRISPGMVSRMCSM